MENELKKTSISKDKDIYSNLGGLNSTKPISKSITIKKEETEISSKNTSISSFTNLTSNITDNKSNANNFSLDNFITEMNKIASSKSIDTKIKLIEDLYLKTLTFTLINLDLNDYTESLLSLLKKLDFYKAPNTYKDTLEIGEASYLSLRMYLFLHSLFKDLAEYLQCNIHQLAFICLTLPTFMADDYKISNNKFVLNQDKIIFGKEIKSALLCSSAIPIDKSLFSCYYSIENKEVDTNENNSFVINCVLNLVKNISL